MANLHDVDWSKIPAPKDDGGALHLVGQAMPNIELSNTSGSTSNLSKINGRTVVYAYPMTGRPDTDLPDGWDMIPGARGCTPQSCAFRDHTEELAGRGINQLFGLSTQDSEYQREAVSRLHLPFPLLSDKNLQLTNLLTLPTLEVQGKTLIKRLTLVIDNGLITHVFYPVFPPDKSVEVLLAWLDSKE